MPSTPGKKPQSGPGAGRVAFIARLDKIQTAVREGHPLVTIYRQLGGEDQKNGLGISYSQFARYVSKYVRSSQRHEPISTLPAPDAGKHAPAATRGQHESPAPPGAGSKPGAGAEQRDLRKVGAGQPRFLHNPSAGSDSDLI